MRLLPKKRNTIALLYLQVWLLQLYVIASAVENGGAMGKLGAR